MTKKSLYVSLILLVPCLAILTCACQSPKPPKLEIYTFPPKSETPSPASPPIISTPPPTAINPPQDYVERKIVVDQRNNVFSIGLPPNTREEAEVIADKPIDFWFEYLPDEAKLEVDGVPVQRSGRWEFKIRYTTGITRFRYAITNATANTYSYNLHLFPTKTGDAVPVSVRQRWQ